MSQKTQFKSVLAVYQGVLKNAQYFREECKRIGNPSEAEPDERERFYICQDIAHELYKVAADLELTREVNPPASDKCSICHEPIYGLVQVHHHNEKCPKCGYEMIATQEHACKN